MHPETEVELRITKYEEIMMIRAIYLARVANNDGLCKSSKLASQWTGQEAKLGKRGQSHVMFTEVS